MSTENLLKTERSWYKRHSPKVFEDVVLPISHRNYFKKVFETGAIPDLIFHSLTPGCGKTTLAGLMGSFFNYEIRFIDGSIDNGIDTVRNKIEPFVSKTKKRGYAGKLVIIEECDRFTEDAQDALRVLLDKKKKTSFVMTCNYINKLQDPLISRLTPYNFDYGTNEIKKEITPLIKDRLKTIYEAEQVDYSQDFLDNIVEKEYPSIRNMIKISQKIYDERGDLTNGEYIVSLSLELIEAIKDFNVKEIFKIMNESDIAYEHIYTYLHKYMIPNLNKKQKMLCYMILKQYMYEHPQQINKEIHLIALFIEIKKSILNK